MSYIILNFPLTIFILSLNVALFAQQSPSSLTDKLNRYTPAVIRADTYEFSFGDRSALRKLIEEAKLMDSIYLRQVWNGNVELLHKLPTIRSARIELSQ